MVLAMSNHGLDHGVERGAAPTGPRLDRAQFAERYRGSYRSLWCVALAVVGDAQEAEDAVQEAALIGLAKLGTFDPSTSFSAWMAQIVRNVASNARRKRARRKTRPTDPDSMGQSVVDPSPPGPGGVFVDGSGRLAAGRDAFDARVLAALDTLSEDARACLLMRVLLDMEYALIARALGISEGAATNHVYRARRAMVDRLGRADDTDARGGGSGGGTPT